MSSHCKIIVISKNSISYAEKIAKLLKNLGIQAVLLFPSDHVQNKMSGENGDFSILELAPAFAGDPEVLTLTKQEELYQNILKILNEKYIVINGNLVKVPAPPTFID